MFTHSLFNFYHSVNHLSWRILLFSFVFCASLLSNNAIAQTETPKDSLWATWANEKVNDSIRQAALNNLIRKRYLFTKPDTAFQLLELLYQYADKINDNKWTSSARTSQGITNHIQGNYYRAIKYYNLGLKIAEKYGNKRQIASSLNNIGIIYKEQEDYDKALEYFLKSFKLKKEIGDKTGLTNAIGNIGSIYSIKQEHGKALDYFNRGLQIQEEVGNKRIIAGFLNNIGSIYMSQKEYEKGLNYINRSLVLRREIRDVQGEASCLTNIGELYYKQGKHNRAIEHFIGAYEIAKESGLIHQTVASTGGLYKAYSDMGDAKNALKMLEENIVAQDSIRNSKNQQEIIRQEFKYQYEKQHLADSLSYAKEKELKEVEHQVKLQKEQNQRYILYGGIGFLLILGGIVFRSYAQKKRNNIALSEKNEIITKQRDLVEEKNKEITDSIQYAKRIQRAILPPHKMVKEFFKDSFILYLPKDIVAGDFYWMEHKDGKVLFAVADCTGHGVPGAMVSVVCNSGLNRSVRELGITDPGKILDKTRELVVSEFEKSEEDVKDGMDIALCSMKNNTIQYAGAHNPLWIIRDRGKQVEEIKANKQPIGKYDNIEPYQTHEINLEKGDTIYLFSDGYADQFGGDNGKKLKAAKLKEMLLSVQDKSMEEQGEYLKSSFEKWKGDLEQLDDVCIIGIRV